MRQFTYRLVNVFAESTFGGNPLCVFEAGAALSDVEMQALALQFNLSETTFILPSTAATARIRIFTPTFEMAFAGHPTLGSSHVVRDLTSVGDSLSLEMKAGVIPVSATGDRWTFKAAAPTSRACTTTRGALASALGLNIDDVLEGARWVNTGSEQLIIPLATTAAVKRTAPSAEKLNLLKSDLGRSMAYVFAPNGDNKLLSRFFFTKHGSIIEDPGTGSATANLGGWMLHAKKTPCRFMIEQGASIDRPCHLGLEVGPSGAILVSGNVIEIGRGTISLADS
jgi:trans-2,3-dihydro-3-hydroxyanthranilate isomerase